MRKGVVLFLIVTLIISSFFVIEASKAQAVSTPRPPEFTLSLVSRLYVVAPTFTTDPFTGKAVVTHEGYHVENVSVDVSIRNQPFTSYSENGSAVDLFYQIQYKGHFANASNWQFFSYSNLTTPIPLTSYYVQSNADQTVVSVPISSDAASVDNITSFPEGGQVDFRVRVLMGFATVTQAGLIGEGVIFNGQTGDWSNPQTIVIDSATARVLIPTPSPPQGSKIITVPTDYPSIQQAINSANVGDTVFVRRGIYNETLTINKSVSLVGEDRNSTIIDARGAQTQVIAVKGDNITIANFTLGDTSTHVIRNSGGFLEVGEGDGIVVYEGSHNINILDNTIIACPIIGIYLYACLLPIKLNDTIFIYPSVNVVGNCVFQSRTAIKIYTINCYVMNNVYADTAIGVDFEAGSIIVGIEDGTSNGVELVLSERNVVQGNQEIQAAVPSPFPPLSPSPSQSPPSIQTPTSSPTSSTSPKLSISPLSTPTSIIAQSVLTLLYSAIVGLVVVVAALLGVIALLLRRRR